MKSLIETSIVLLTFATWFSIENAVNGFKGEQCPYEALKDGLKILRTHPKALNDLLLTGRYSLSCKLLCPKTTNTKR